MRDEVPTLIATVSDDGSNGDFGQTSFTFVSEALKSLERRDYLMLQATAKVSGGSGAKNSAGFVDVHFEALT